MIGLQEIDILAGIILAKCSKSHVYFEQSPELINQYILRSSPGKTVSLAPAIAQEAGNRR